MIVIVLILLFEKASRRRVLVCDKLAHFNQPQLFQWLNPHIGIIKLSGRAHLAYRLGFGFGSTIDCYFDLLTLHGSTHFDLGP